MGLILRGVFLLLGVGLLLPGWLVGVHWEQVRVVVLLLPFWTGNSLTVGLPVAKLVLGGVIGILLIGLLLSLPGVYRRLREAGFGSTERSVGLAFFVLLVGIVCLEPFPIFQKERTWPSFDMTRNIFLSLPAFLRTGGLILLLVGIGGNRRRRLGRYWDSGFRKLTRLGHKTTLWAVGGSAFLLALIFSSVGFQGLPSIRDEVAALFQAGIFARGEVVTEAPPWSEFMDTSPIISTPSWASMYPPGWAALLAIGKTAGAASVVNPFLTGLLAALMFSLFKRLAGKEAAWLGLLLLLSSPFFVRLSGSYMSHISTLLFLTLCLSIVLVWPERSSSLWGVAAGLAIGVTLAIRPLAALCVAAPSLVLSVGKGRTNPRKAMGFWLPFTGGAAIVLSALLLFNELTTGSWAMTGYMARLGEQGSIGFGERAMGDHTVLLGLFHDAGRFFRLCGQLFGFPFAGAVLVATGVLANRWNSSHKALLLGSFLLCLTSGTYWWYEQWFGPRYLLEGIPALILVAAMGLHRLISHPNTRYWVSSGLTISLGWAAVAALPSDLLTLRQGYGEVDRTTVSQLRVPELEGAAILIQDSDWNSWPHDTYTSAFLAMVLDDFSGAVMLRDLESRNEILSVLLPDREWFYYRHGDETGEGSLTGIDSPNDVTRGRNTGH